MKKFLTLFIIFVMTAGCMSGCSASDADEAAETYGITLDIDGDYKIYPDMTQLEASTALECESTDESVAVVRSGNHICALRTGTAQITVKAEGKTTKYNVTVNSGNAQARSADSSSEGISETDLYIGYGFDTTSGEELDASSMSETPLFDLNKIYNSDEALMMDFEPKNTVSAFARRSKEELINKYSEKADVSVSVDVFGLVKIQKNLMSKYENSVNGYSSDTGIFNSLSVNYQRASVWLTEDKEHGGYSALLTKQAAEDLYGEDCLSTREFIEKYGTHVLVSGIYGQKVDCNYVISDEPSSPLKTPSGIFLKNLNSSNSGYEDISGENIDFYNNLILEYTFNDGSTDETQAGEGTALIERDIDEHNGYKCSDKNFSYRVVGRMEYFESQALETEGDCYESSGSCIPEFTHAYRLWQEYSDEYYKENPDDIGTLIGPRNEHSLVPVWELIPKSSEKYYDRKNEFLNDCYYLLNETSHHK